MNKRLIVITGATRGLGLVAVNEFLENDWQVIGTGIGERPESFPANAQYVAFDASNFEACATFWQDTVADNPDAQICLVNNAGGYVGGDIASTAPEEYAKQLGMNYFPAVCMTKSLVAAVSEARIITIVSSVALSPKAKNTAYGSSKAAEKYFLQALQEELDDKKYRLTNIYPNSIATSGPNSKAITPEELAVFVRDQAELNKSYYIRDVVLYSFV
jgi:NAD(P)-dependent dehydrogenase (short-subunit alcohol dehydrogenase family)